VSGASASLRVGLLSSEDLEVAAFHGEEAISSLFRFDVTVRSPTDLVTIEPALLGAPATLTMTTEKDALAVVQGIVTALSTDGSHHNKKRAYGVRIEPRLSLLRKRRNSRIFQAISVVDIINQIFAEHRVAYLWNLSKKYPLRNYVVQYQETDWAFVTRLAAEAGIFFFFVPPEASAVEQGAPPETLSETVVLCDGAQHYPSLGISGASEVLAQGIAAAAVPYRAQGGALEGGEAIRSFSYRRAIRPQVVTLRDYDFERPRLELGADAQKEEIENAPSALFSAEPPPPGQPLEIYEHQAEYGETDVSKDHAARRLEGERARALLARGEGSCRRFAAGRRFSLEDHPQPELNGEDYALVRVEHTYKAPEGGEREAYTNRFACVPARIPYRARKKQRSLSQVLESAEVVGPPGEEIHTDRYGRVKVRFHWDRVGSSNPESSSCWLRVSQPWAGNSWGSQFIPRVGMEVLVSFLGGDEDRPIILGAVYNATHPPPFPLPLGKTKSGFRTQSVGGAGSSELSFEDGAGAEVVLLRSQRDLRESAGNDHVVEVSRDQTTVVSQSQRITVGGARSINIGGDESRSTSGASSHNVGGDHLLQVSGSRREAVAGSSSSDINGLRLHDRGSEKHIIEGFMSMAVGTDETPTGLDVVVHGHENHTVDKSNRLGADTQISLECGGSRITISPESVRIESKEIVFRAKEKLRLFGDGPAIELGKEVDVLADGIKMFSKGGSIELDAEAAHVDGPLVKLNCGAGSAPEIEDDPENPKTKTFQWRCLDANLEPCKSKTYRLVGQGFRCKGTTDEDGVIQEDIPIDAMMAELTVWLDEYPAGERLQTTVRLEKQPPASSILGAAIRLTNLGYYFGPETDELTADLSCALREFQHDHKLVESGELDAETVDKLDEVHPS